MHVWTGFRNQPAREMVLSAVDLFTGIGGFVRALDQFSVPIVYCDADPKIRSALAELMPHGRVPDAPVVKDVRDTDGIKRAVSGRRVDIVTAGSPCTGFSRAGGRRGMEDDTPKRF